MNKKLKDQWIEDLRSGQYKQCKDELFTDEGFCCLGILECVSGPKVGIDRPYSNSDAAFSNIAGVLIIMNDYEDKTFPEIADYIEKNV